MKNEYEILDVSSSSATDSFDDYELQKEGEEIEQNQEEVSDVRETTHLDNIICIELMNNNKIYLNYSKHWKVRDVSLSC